MSGSPQLIAGCHVLLRLPMPRHSPCALFSLNSTCGSYRSRSGSLGFLSLELLESRKQLFRLHITSSQKTFLCFAFLSPFLVKLYFTLDQQKNLRFSIDLNYLFVLLVSYSVFNEHKLSFNHLPVTGGLKWTRTTDLVLIRHAL